MAPQLDPNVEALSEFSTCDVSDALLKLKVPHGGFLAGITMYSPERQTGATKIVGPAYTVKYALLSDPAAKHPTHYIDAVPEGAVLFVSSPRTPNAVFGGLMATRAQYRGCTGAVIDGRLRDLQEHRDLRFPVFARDVGTTAPAEVAKVVGIDVAVQLQPEGQAEAGAITTANAIIHPGDYVIADLNGVVVLPRGLAAQALSLIKKQVTADEQLATALRGGASFAEASKKFRG
ncbi:ribonuclease e inhibitor rraa/dimethylmenaquinone methyltransferase [Grosmannia clavigera kw1407]|uniref:Ribonuclease e inhibitor rraa/dimethylmenaquinone methyltransferase n=1 Tax=Grosmannia clavigera (strain kw1407 / UAMH 11150) TaxID=655863 RepID=F0XNZ7_GROCL|nr:ribonuclease e inhibitor rraa/dimethylmenaquinone methyltransferase [Grosmannia clavigera kw1407]EFX00078.1 ribonuclease e inhibitor rraa/dimethylmenaquinone methyltransferase [Grosmannia clavigera kw1407]